MKLKFYCILLFFKNNYYTFGGSGPAFHWDKENKKRQRASFKNKGKRRNRKGKHETSMAAAEGSCGGGGMKSSPAPTKAAGSGAAKFLSGMPSRGNFSFDSISSSLVWILPA
jgi:hypothetical protein